MMHTFTVYVEDRPGVLNRVVVAVPPPQLQYHSLAVGHSETPGVSRMTVVVQTDAGGAQRIQAHLYKLIHVHPRRGHHRSRRRWSVTWR